MAARGRSTRGPRVRVSKDGLALAGYALLVALFNAPLLLGQHTFPGGDFTNQFLHFHRLLRDELLAGRLPVWNPYTFAGHPYLADVQAAVFYPVSNLLLLLTAPWSSLAARLYWLQVEAVLHVLLGGFFTYLFARDLTGRRLSSRGSLSPSPAISRATRRCNSRCYERLSGCPSCCGCSGAALGCRCAGAGGLPPPSPTPHRSSRATRRASSWRVR